MSEAGVAPALFEGEADFLPGVSGFLSSAASDDVLLDFGRLSSDFFDVTLASYGLNASLDSPGELRWILSNLSRVEAGEDLVMLSEADFFGLSI